MDTQVPLLRKNIRHIATLGDVDQVSDFFVKGAVMVLRALRTMPQFRIVLRYLLKRRVMRTC